MSKLYSASKIFDHFDEVDSFDTNNNKRRNVQSLSQDDKETSSMQTQNNTMAFRPTKFYQVIGQTEIIEYLKLKIAAFKKTRKSLSHTLFLGFSGLGKTTLANVVALEMGVTFHQVMATRIKTFNDLYSIIKNIEEGDVVFIDEIHALSEKMQEHLYGIMEDFKCTIEDKNLNRQIERKIPQFTLIGATTHSGLLQAPLLSRFHYKPTLQPYSLEDLTKMITTVGERVYNIEVPHEVANRLAMLSKRTARIAYSLLHSLMVLAESETPGKVLPSMLDMKLVNRMLKFEQLDPIIGLDIPTRKYLMELIKEDGFLGAETLARMINEQEITVRSMIEPFLFTDIELRYMENGSLKTEIGPFVRITKKGRQSLDIAKMYIKICKDLQKSGWFSTESLNY